MGKLIRNGIEYGGGNGTDIYEVTQSQYNTLKQAGTLVRNALYVITDAENLNCTADDIEYSTGVSVKTAIDGKADTTSAVQIATFSFTASINASTETTFTITRTEFNLPSGAKVKDGYIKQSNPVNTNSYWAYSCIVNPTSSNAMQGSIYNPTATNRNYTIMATVFYTL